MSGTSAPPTGTSGPSSWPGNNKLPICMAKTQLSITDDPKLKGAPKGWTLNVKEVLLSAGAGFVVPLCGEIMLIPGLPSEPAAERIDYTDDGPVHRAELIRSVLTDWTSRIRLVRALMSWLTTKVPTAARSSVFRNLGADSSNRTLAVPLTSSSPFHTMTVTGSLGKTVDEHRGVPELPASWRPAAWPS